MTVSPDPQLAPPGGRFWPASSVAFVAIILQTGATSAVKAVKLSAKQVTGSVPDAEATAPVAAAGPAT